VWWAGCTPPLPDIPHAFVAVVSEPARRQGLPVDILGIDNVPTDWSTDPKEGELIVARTVHDLRDDPDDLATDFADGIAFEAERANPIVEMMAAALGWSVRDICPRV
jgi:hypothetical protein